MEFSSLIHTATFTECSSVRNVLSMSIYNTKNINNFECSNKDFCITLYVNEYKPKEMLMNKSSW